MLTRAGNYDETTLVGAAMEYIPLYNPGGAFTRVEIPYKEQGSGLIHYVIFEYWSGEWHFMKIKP